MKTVYIAYKFKEQNPEELRKKLEELSKVIKEATSYKTFIFFRDMQNWGKIKMPIKEIVEKACKEIEKCDTILVEATEKANGAYFEAGYAKALGKKVIIVHKTGTETNFLDSIADISIEYDNFDDLKEKLMNSLD